MGLEEYKGVYIYAQQVDNKLSDIAFELVGKAKELAADLNTEVTAVLLGSNVKALATELGEYGADKVIVVDNPALETYRTEPYAQALVSVINEYKPEIMLVGATAIGRDLGPTVSARVKTGLTADCTKLEIGDFPINAMPGQEQKHNQLLMTRPAFGGNTIATIACPDNRPQMATVRPGVLQKLTKEAGRAAEVIEFNPALEENNRYVEIKNESLKSKAAKDALGDVMDQVVDVNGIKLLATSVDGVDMNGLRDLGDSLKEKLGEGVIVLASSNEGKVNLVAMATDAAIKSGAHAGNLIKAIASKVGGGGGGRTNMAQAGGKNPAGIPDAAVSALGYMGSAMVTLGIAVAFGVFWFGLTVWLMRNKLNLE